MGLCISKQGNDLPDGIDSDAIDFGEVLFSRTSNSKGQEISTVRMLTLRGIMDALADSDINVIGVSGPDGSERARVAEKVSRKAMRDGLFDVVVKAKVTKKPDLKRIQNELSEIFGVEFESQKDVAQRGRCLCDKIKEHHKILIILCDVSKSIDLGIIGIPFGEDHRGCKILLTSASEEVSSNHMHTQKNFTLNDCPLG